jgi:arylamine N-acetyltransferase
MPRAVTTSGCASLMSAASQHYKRGSVAHGSTCIARSLTHATNIEYEITNWYTAIHPDAPYATNIIAARPHPDGMRLTMFNERVNLRSADGRVERRVMTSRNDYARVLRDEFGLALRDNELDIIMDCRSRHGVPGAFSHPLFG